MYFLTFYPNGEYCFQVAKMTPPCRWGLDEVDLLVEIHQESTDDNTFIESEEEPL